MKNITFIGAGSSGFTRGLIKDILTFSELSDCCFTLMDIDQERLGISQLDVRMKGKFGLILLNKLNGYCPLTLSPSLPEYLFKSFIDLVSIYLLGKVLIPIIPSNPHSSFVKYSPILLVTAKGHNVVKIYG